MAIYFRPQNAPSWFPPVSIAGGVLPNSLPMKAVVETVVSQYIKNLLPPLPKLPNLPALKTQALRYLQTLSVDLVPPQYKVLIDVAKSGVPGAAGLLLKMQFARMIPRNFIP